MSAEALAHVWNADCPSATHKLVLIYLANGSPCLGYEANLDWHGMAAFAGFHWQDGPKYVGELADAGLLHWPDQTECFVAHDGEYVEEPDWDSEPKKLKARVRALLMRDGDGCCYCKKTFPHYHVDHVIPRSRGGPDKLDNLVLACPPCNMAKGARTPEEWGGPL